MTDEITEEELDELERAIREHRPDLLQPTDRSKLVRRTIKPIHERDH